MPQAIGQLKKSLDDEWKRCVKDKGLTPDSEMTVKEEKNIPQSTTPSEEEIRIAVIQAQCNQDVGRSQKLYDLEAQYQKPLVAKNQAPWRMSSKNSSAGTSSSSSMCSTTSNSA